MHACVVHGAGDLRVEERPYDGPAPGEIEVAVALGGICGSDLHYYHRGRVGDFAVSEPMVLGHEVVGHVAALGPGVGGPDVPAVGAPVAIHPATPCGVCPECARGTRNVCAHTRYLGSAAHTPHVQGGFAQRLAVPAGQVRELPAGLDLRRAVLAEPLAVALHAVRRAGEVRGKRVLVAGAGPIGCLVVAALRHAGAAAVVTGDLHEEPLRIASEVGATATARADRPDDPNWAGVFDVAVEASGAPAGLRSCVERARRGGTVVMLGLLPPGEIGLLGNVAVTRELELRGSFRFDTEFDEALSLLAQGLPVDPVVTHTFPLERSVAAFETARDRTVASKVLLDLTDRA
ncbi:L-idonate 5-dehydrogenase [Streptomyces sp. SP18BB07]|uniref:L-idonate 5-dehydrogenase n=1 Tax=Streptomyces sp. SP18BB07 TaxID=3002522 RepID=UPI002E7967BB|nr:L-idonate 5-dehydrogenase [Streptomyces sp. SP18BB07]MEE1760427.1 L-idonate 5-dehydrogenase [Streptomyces sp. SP18BB07]